MNNVTLTVAGKQYGGWEEVTINLGIKQMAGDFSLVASDRWPGGWGAQPIRAGDACTVAIDGATVITGYVDRVNPRYDADGHNITITGRDKAGDLVDCSAIYKSGHWSGATLLQIASDLCQPFSVEVKADADLGAPFKDFAIQEGETVFEAISRAAGMRGVLAISNGAGGLTLTRAGTARHDTTLKNPGNIKAASGEFSLNERFSEYITKGQRRGTDDDVGTPELLSSPSGQVTDPGVKRYRPLIVLAEDQGTKTTFEQRAAWERNVRIGNALSVRATVFGWLDQGEKGKLWAINRLVKIVDRWLWLDDTLLIAGVSFYRGPRGTLTYLELTNPAAFELLAEPEQQTAIAKVKAGSGR